MPLAVSSLRPLLAQDQCWCFPMWACKGAKPSVSSTLNIMKFFFFLFSPSFSYIFSCGCISLAIMQHSKEQPPSSIRAYLGQIPNLFLYLRHSLSSLFFLTIYFSQKYLHFNSESDQAPPKVFPFKGIFKALMNRGVGGSLTLEGSWPPSVPPGNLPVSLHTW